MKLENNRQTIEINDKIYNVATRTAITEKKLKEHDEKIKERSEYENNKEVIEIILGEDAFAEIFPNGETESLDNISLVAFACLEAFFKTRDDAAMNRAKKNIHKLNSLKPNNKNTHPAYKKK